MSQCRAGDTEAKVEFEAVGEAIRAAFCKVTADAVREDARTCVRVSFRFSQPNVQVRGLACTCPLHVTTCLLHPDQPRSRMHNLSPPHPPPLQRAVVTFVTRVPDVVTSPEVVAVSGRLCVVVCCCAKVRVWVVVGARGGGRRVGHGLTVRGARIGSTMYVVVQDAFTAPPPPPPHAGRTPEQSLRTWAGWWT